MTAGAQKPDIVIVLPEQRTMIIDSKVPLAGYERLIAAQEEADRLAAGDRFVRDVKAHIDDSGRQAISGQSASSRRMIAR